MKVILSPYTAINYNLVPYWIINFPRWKGVTLSIREANPQLKQVISLF